MRLVIYLQLWMISSSDCQHNQWLTRAQPRASYMNYRWWLQEEAGWGYRWICRSLTQVYLFIFMHNNEAVHFLTALCLCCLRWSGFLLCAVAMLLVIFPMFTFPKKLPPRHKKKKRRKKVSLDDLSSDDDVLKEKSNNNKNQTVTSSMGFGKDIKGTRTTAGRDVNLELRYSNIDSVRDSSVIKPILFGYERDSERIDVKLVPVEE